MLSALLLQLDLQLSPLLGCFLLLLFKSVASTDELAFHLLNDCLHILHLLRLLLLLLDVFSSLLFFHYLHVLSFSSQFFKQLLDSLLFHGVSFLDRGTVVDESFEVVVRQSTLKIGCQLGTSSSRLSRGWGSWIC